MRKLFLFSVILLFIACDKKPIPPTPQEICEQQILDMFNSVNNEYGYYSDFVFSDIVRADIPLDSIYSYYGWLYTIEYFDSLLNDYIQLYGENSTQTIFTPAGYLDYQGLINQIDGLNKIKEYIEDTYTPENYTMQFSYIYNEMTTQDKWLKRKELCLGYFNKNYKYITHDYLSTEQIK